MSKNKINSMSLRGMRDRHCEPVRVKQSSINNKYLDCFADARNDVQSLDWLTPNSASVASGYAFAITHSYNIIYK
ncbi:MAG: hypothetical protein LBH30_06920 [Prevotellaceae bacterium]|nr:hypothetical protein [Prevotellaceae bacterium]